MHSPMAAQILMRKGKRGAALHVQAECSRTADPQHLKELLNTLLNPQKPIDDLETVDWIKWLIAGGKNPPDFASTVRRYDNGTTCGLVWTANFVAYRCRTCGISPCMSLCAECFQKGNHDGHDFNMFRSQAGGACDCGDPSVMKESGFCERHGSHAQLGKPISPPELLAVAQATMPRIILRLIQHLRSHSIPDNLEEQLQHVQEADNFISLLHEYSGMGAAMRHVMTSAFVNQQLYAQLTEVPAEDSEYAQFMKEAQRMYEKSLESLPGPEPPDEYKEYPALRDTLIHRTFLEELVFWTVKFEFPQKLVCLLLNMLPDPDYKEAFTRAFVLHYARISLLLVGSADPDTLSNRVVHVSVQLFSNEELASQMTEELRLLHVMVVSLRDMMSKILTPSTLQDPKKNFHFVVDCSKHVMRDHCYWPLVSDLSNLLSHRPVALQFLSDDNLLEMWFSFLSMFQGMNVNQRELTTHVEFEPNTYYAAFSAELEAPASAMWALAIHLRDFGSIHLTKMLLKHCKSALEEWLEAINFNRPEQTDPFQVSFHIPLHRYLAAFTCQAVRAQGIPLKDILPSNSLLQLIMMHPLRIQVAFYEILSGLWVRNGLQIKGQAMSYIQCHFGNSMVDADLYLLQLCCTQLSPAMVLPTIFERFHIMEFLSLNPQVKSTFLEGDQQASMLESCLTFLASLMSIRTNIGLKESDLDRLEMVSLLCMSDRTHSQLMELLPEKCGSPQNKDFDAVLAQVADYKAPNFEASGSMQQGMYVPKAAVWEQLYDPIYVLLRAVHRRDFQTSMDRFTQYVRQSGKYPGYTSSTLWPPFRLPIETHPSYEDPRKILLSKTFHALLFMLLYKAVHSPLEVSEQSLALIIYLLDMAVSMALQQPVKKGNELCIREPVHLATADNRTDLKFNDWFLTDSLAENVCTVINYVKLTTSTTVSVSSTEAAELDVETSTSTSSTSNGESSDQDMDLDVSETTGAENPMLALPETESHALVPILPHDSNSVSVYRNVNRLTTISQPHFRVVPALSSTSVSQERMMSRVATTSTTIAQLPYSTVQASTTGNEITKYSSQVSVESTASESSVAVSAIQFENSADGGDGGTRQRVCILESIVSLLLRLQTKFSGHSEQASSEDKKTDVFLSAPAAGGTEEDGRIGDGAFWIHKVLNKMSHLDPRVKQSIISTRQALWPPRTSDDGLPDETTDEVEEREKKRKIKERQQRLLQEFATKQKMFMQQAMAAEDMETDTDVSSIGTGSTNLINLPPASVNSNLNDSPPDTQQGSLKSTADPEEAVSEEYDCVICNQASSSTLERPMCLVVLLQATSILAHKRYLHPGVALTLPISDDDHFNLNKVDTLATEMERRIEHFRQNFDETSWLSSLNIGYEGGVYVHTCGHYLHLDCHKQYLVSLRSQQRQQSLNVERGEYSCPLCRQLANSALPIATQLYSKGTACTKKSRLSGIELSAQNQASSEIFNTLRTENPINLHGGSNLMEAMGRVMEDMTNVTYPRFRQITPSPSPASLFLFVQSIARANLEIELLQRGDSLNRGSSQTSTSGSLAAGSNINLESVAGHHSGSSHQLPSDSSPTPGTSSANWNSPGLELRFSSSPTPSGLNTAAGLSSSSTSPWSLLPKRSCTLALLHVLATHSKILATRPYQELWSQISGIPSNRKVDTFDAASIVKYERDVPLMTQDVSSLLLQFVLILPLPLERQHFICIVQRLFNLVLVQITAQLICHFGDKKRKQCRSLNGSDWNMMGLASFVFASLDDNQLYLQENSDSVDENKSLIFEADVQQPIYQLSLHYLRIASLLQFHLFGDALPESGISHTDHEEFVELCSYLSLSHEPKFDACLDPRDVIGQWCREFRIFVSKSPMDARSLLVQHRPRRGPRLLTLPHSYDILFQFYHHKACAQCKCIPKEPSLCLVCGTLVCLRENCCKEDNMHEAVQHSIDCGAGTAIFLAVNSSTIIVIRGKRACLWGSVYLDTFGEEDRELKRGKPLYLSKERYALLESQWLSHRFDHTNKKWIWHRDVL